MREQDQKRIKAMMALQSEREVIFGTSEDSVFFPTQSLYKFVYEDWDSRVSGGEVPYNVICWAAEKLSRYREAGIPVLSVMEVMSSVVSESASHLVPEGSKSDIFMEMAALILENEGDVDTRIEKYVGHSFRSYLSFNPVSGSIALTPLATQENYSTGNYRSIIQRSIYHTFRGQIRPSSHNQTYLNMLIDNAVRKYCAVTSPTEELTSNLSKHEDQLPDLDNTEIPAKISEGEGPWSEVYNLLSPWFEAYGIKGKSREEELFTRMLVGLSARTFEPGCIMQWMLLLQGKAGTCKTGMGQILALDMAPSVTTSPMEIGKIRTIEAINGASVVVLDEMDVSTAKRDIAENKTFISETSHRLRRSYRKDAESIPASWVLIGTTNAESLPHDDGAGMRRYGIVKVPGGYAEGEYRAAFMLENRRLLHAISTALYQAGYPWDLDSELVRENAKTSQAFVETPGETELLEGYMPYLAQTLTTENGCLIQATTKTIWQLLTTEGRFHPRRAASLVTTLERHGWTRSRPGNRITFWVPPSFQNRDYTVKPFHPDNLPMLRKALAALDVEGYSIKVGEEETEPEPKPPTPKVSNVAPKPPKKTVSTPKAPKPSSPPQTPPGATEGQLKAIIKQMGLTCPDTTSTLVLAKFIRDQS